MNSKPKALTKRVPVFIKDATELNVRAALVDKKPADIISSLLKQTKR